jgi:hypothetical protein
MKDRLEETKKYLNYPSLYILSNNERFDFKEYDYDKIVIPESFITSRQIDLLQPHYESKFKSTNELSDESEYINLGFNEKHYKARTHVEGPYQPSLMRDFPYNYKIVGSGLFANGEVDMTQRGSDDILMVFGDVGGMAAFMGLALKFLVDRFADLQLRAELIKHLYK